MTFKEYGTDKFLGIMIDQHKFTHKWFLTNHIFHSTKLGQKTRTRALHQWLNETNKSSNIANAWEQNLIWDATS